MFPSSFRSVSGLVSGVVTVFAVVACTGLTKLPPPTGNASSARGAAVADWAVKAAARSAQTPPGLPQMPQAQALRAEAVALGRKLFFDRRLSLNGTMSCAMCHVPEQAFANNEMAIAVGINGLSARRNAPSVLNVGFYSVLFQDGRENSLETQYFSPLLAANEMANPSVGHVMARLQALPDYVGLFEQAFGHPASPDGVGQALAAYQRTLQAGRTRFDQWRFGGRGDALSDQEKEGFALFTGKAGCNACHLAGTDEALLSDQRFHDNGYGWMREQERQNPPEARRVRLAPGQYVMVDQSVIDSVGLVPREDLGRYEVTFEPSDLWSFRTPQLRNVALTAPYMHDGGFSSLMQVLRFYNQGGAPHKEQSPLIRPLGLTERQLQALEAFLHSLTSPDIAQLAAEARVERPDSYR